MKCVLSKDFMLYGRWELILGQKAGNPRTNIEVLMGHAFNGGLSIAMFDYRRLRMMGVHPIFFCTTCSSYKFALGLVFGCFDVTRCFDV